MRVAEWYSGARAPAILFFFLLGLRIDDQRLVGSLAEAALHATRERDRAVAVFFAELVGGAEGVLPLGGGVVFGFRQQRKLPVIFALFGCLKICGLHAQQTNEWEFPTLRLPVGAE